MSKNQVLFLFSIFVLSNLPDTLQKCSVYRPEDAKLNFTGLAKKYNMITEEYDVITEDGYILTLFHIPGNRNRAVLLMHGILDSADTFIIRGNTSLAAALSTQGYDVWIGNLRGNHYSRRHVELDPDIDKEFWDFTVHEFGVYDAPAILNFISQRGVNKVSVIAHSQGNMAFYVLGSMKPEYNDRINVLIALGPVCYLNKNNFKYSLRAIVEVGPILNQILQAFNNEELFGENSMLIYLRNKICTQKIIGYKLCGVGVFSELAGYDIEEFEPHIFYSVIGHYPTSTSRKNAVHLFQIAERKEFARYDYGPKINLEKYGVQNPPNYDLEKVTMKVALIAGRNDNITPLKNVALLKNKLPNVVSFNLMDSHPKFNHIDHVWGRNMYKYLFPDVMKLLNKYY